MNSEPEGKFEGVIWEVDPQQSVNCTTNRALCIIHYDCCSFKECIIYGQFKCDGHFDAGIRALTTLEICPENSNKNCNMTRENSISFMNIFKLKNEVYQTWSLKCFALDLNNFPFPKIKALINFSLVFDGSWKFFLLLSLQNVFLFNGYFETNDEFKYRKNINN